MATLHTAARTLVATLAVAIAPAASAIQWEIGAGQSFAKEHGDGVWYQTRFPHKLDLRSAAFKIGATGEFGPSLRWHVDAVHLGRYGSDAFATPHDDNYSKVSHTGCNGACLPLVRYTGEGTVGGFAATLEAHTTGTWKLGAEVGPFLYRASWKMRVPGWYPSALSSGGEFTPSAAPMNLDIDRSHWKVGGVVGVTVGHGSWNLSLRQYLDGAGFDIGSDPWPPIWKRHTVLMLNYRFD
jgi:hypothetical protein